MEGHATASPTQHRGTGLAARAAAGRAPQGGAAEERPRRGHDLVLLALLLLAAAGLRAWLIRHTEVPARDTIGYVRYAWELGHRPWIQTIQDLKQQQHPGYPAAVWAMSRLVRPAHPGPEALVMQLSAQLVSALAGVLLVVPMFYLGRELFSRPVGFAAALLFQVLPTSGRVLADGLSEGLFLLFVASSLLTAALALRRHSVVCFALTGLFGGLAYLVRPEGALVVAATGVVLLAGQFRPAWRTSWRRALACGLVLALALLATGGPLVAVTGKLTPKQTPYLLLNNLKRMFLGEDPALPTAAPTQASAPRLMTAGRMAPLAVWDLGAGDDRGWWGARALGFELVKGSFYVAWPLTLLGLWWFRDRFRRVPGIWVLLLVSLTVAVLLWRVAVGMGYLSDRHTLLILLCGTYPAVAAVPEVVRRLAPAAAWAAARVPALARLGERWPAASPVWPALFLLGLLGSMLPRALEPLHANRRGFQYAGFWLAEHSAPWDEVIDPYCWSHYYAGKVFLEGVNCSVPAGTGPTRYVVLEMAGHEHSRLPELQRAMDLSRQGRPEFCWHGRRGKEDVDVVVYAVREPAPGPTTSPP
jgi:hypothetical protein